jgi:hypothetical protein
MAGNYQVSNKLPDGRIFVIGGETFAEYKTNLVEVLGTEGADNVIGQMAAALEGQPISMQQAVANLAPLNATPVQQPPQTFTPSTAPTGKTCKHGEMSRRTGAGAKGPWKAFMCPSPKGTPDQCEPIWVRRNEPEWSTF